MCCEGGETLLFPDCFLDAFLGSFLPPVRPRLRPVRAAATEGGSSLSMSDSVFLEFAETDLLRRGSLDFADCREEEEMEERGDSMGREAVESLREAGSCAPCPSGREGVSERPETWRTREGVAEPAAGASESAVAGRAAAAAVEAAPVAGASPPAGSTTSQAATTAPVAESPPGIEGGEDEGVEAAPVAGAAPPAGATTSLAAATLPMREPPPGIVEDDGVEETRAARPLSAAAAMAAGEAAPVAGAAPPAGTTTSLAGKGGVEETWVVLLAAG
jgi:hypothetical protein